jgi:hypothetical protein
MKKGVDRISQPLYKGSSARGSAPPNKETTMTTYQAKDPSGLVHEITTKRKVAFAIFVLTKAGTYQSQFAATANAAKSTWGSKSIGLTRAIKVA